MHIKLIHKKIFKCGKCDFTASNEKSAVNHLQIVHGQSLKIVHGESKENHKLEKKAIGFVPN